MAIQLSLGGPNLSAEIALCLDASPTALRFALFRCDEQDEQCLARGMVGPLASPQASATMIVGGLHSKLACSSVDIGAAVAVVLGLMRAHALPAPTVVGHRVAHGGPAHVAPVRIDDGLLHSLAQLVAFAPLQLPVALAAVEASCAQLPNLDHVACFDTAFHAELPEPAARYPLPHELYAQGVRRYGSRGLSFEYVLSTLGVFPPNRVVIAHLDGETSVVAVREGRSIDTTTGLTPSAGIMTGTGSGDLDPGVLLYLQREKGHSLAQVEDLLNRHSGSLAIAGIADVEKLTEQQERDPLAHLAILMFAHAIRKTIGGYFAALGGLDLLVFTGAIGERSAAIRQAVCNGLDALGVSLDASKNAAHERAIHAGTCPVLVIASDEARMVARYASSAARSVR